MAKRPPKHAPDFTLADTEDNPVTLSKVLSAGQRVLLVFLRHLG